MEDVREKEFLALVRHAQASPDVIGLFLFGSRGRDDGLSDVLSDYDVGVVLSSEDARTSFEARCPYRHGAPLEVVSSTLVGLRKHGEYGTPSAWARPQYARVSLLVDKTGEVAALLAQKRTVPDDVRDRVVREALGGYINSAYRSLRYGMVGAQQGARLDAAESLPHFLTAAFAMDRRVRPFNKYLASELRLQPLSDPAWAAARLLPRLDAVLRGEVAEQHLLFCDVDRVARERGFGDAIDDWELDLSWLRGECEYRAVR